MMRFLLFLGLLICTTAYTQPGNQYSLSGTWKVSMNGGDPLIDTLHYMDVHVPMDLNLAMQKKGLVGDVNYGSNYLLSGWVALQQWQYYRHFNAPAEALNKTAWLKFDCLDYAARISLNGEYLASSDNANIPFLVNVTGKLKKGDNILMVNIESGLYDAADKPSADYSRSGKPTFFSRFWLRKPQYQFGWDWNPRLINVGITGDVTLIWRDIARLDQVVPLITMNDDLTLADLTIKTFIEGTEIKEDLTVEATLIETNQKVSEKFNVTKGIQPFVMKMTVNKPKLWWPVGNGDPNLYTLKIDLKKDGKLVDSESKRIGFRTIKIDQSKHPVEGTYFMMKVNNRPVFMKGGNWVPPDMIYSNIDNNRTRKLVDLALDANFNFLRIWGGGTFAGNELLSLCDEKGIVVWHDFLFACNEYPGDDIPFYNNTKKEVTWAVREFAYHPSLAVWCGNNENEEGLWNWGFLNNGKIVTDFIIYHHLMPVIMKEEDPTRFYWPSSPYSENNIVPTSPITGDQHPWGVSLQKDTTNIWAYRNYVDRFPNEGGVLGASTPATLRQFLPKGEQYIRSVSWELHDNSENGVKRGDIGLTYKIIKDWLGKDYLTMSLDDYSFASGLMQSEGLMEYINNFHRRMYSSASAVFWMYNDSWPVTNGWTIVDYYLRKKLAYHPVRRAFEQVSVVVAGEGDRINIYGVNEKQEPWKGKLQYGLFETDGKLPFNRSLNVTLKPNSSTLLASFEKRAFENAGFKNHGAFAVLSDKEKVVSQHRLFLAMFKDLAWFKPQISIDYSNNKAIITSPVYVWGVTLDVNGESEVSDNCFDLLPGVPYVVNIRNGEKIKVEMTGNDLMMK